MIYSAASSLVVTPQSGIPLSGSGMPSTSFDSVHDEIELNGVKIKGKGHDIFVISTDFLSVDSEVREFLLGEFKNVDRNGLFIFSSHTHSAPAVDHQLALLGSVDLEYYEYIKTQFVKLLSNLIEAEYVACNLQIHSEKFDRVISRRRKIMAINLRKAIKVSSQIKMLPNYDNNIPKDLTVIKVSNDSEVLFYCVHLACHPTCIPNKTVLSADYPGEIRLALRAKNQQNLPVLFLQGFSGDIRPELFDSSKSIEKYVKKLIFGQIFGAVSKKNWNAWLDELKKCLLKCEGRISSRNIITSDSEIYSMHSTFPVTAINEAIEGPVSTRYGELGLIQLGNNLSILAISGEPTSDYINILSKYITSDNVICVGYLGHVFGYIPSNDQLQEGGYEVHGFRGNFNLPGEYFADIEDRIVCIFRKLILSKKL